MKVRLVNCMTLSVMILLGIPKWQTIDLKNLTADCAVCDECDSSRTIRFLDWLCFDLLCELVDCNVQELKAPDSSGEGAEDVEPPDRKRPG